MGTREDITRAVLEGTTAAKNGAEPTTCPYPGTSVLRTAWIRGYVAARPVTEPDE
ncbi:Rmf/CrpP fold protein [Streptomyces sp. WAC01280]|uniref:Rmf/CrpP fold protein n=1 Tax=Streptomyces sp. WAC01280 TaxID=2487424 RepID=UPI00163B9AB8|nr:Rmf/CrpP fold protein [Streptomyces sp. WAC01280]